MADRFEFPFTLIESSTGNKLRFNWCGAFTDSPRMSRYTNGRLAVDLSEDQVRAGLIDGTFIDGDPVLECLDGPDGCKGAVAYRSVGQRWARPRCEKHFQDRLDLQDHINELRSLTPASWFDESYAGERWDEDY